MAIRTVQELDKFSGAPSRSEGTGIGAFDYEEAVCCFCGPHEKKMMHSDSGYHIVRCAGCGLVYTTPRIVADQLEALYQDTYWRSPSPKHCGYAHYIEDKGCWFATYRRRLQHIAARMSAGQALDVGCAAGFWTSVLREAGWEAYGVDISAPMIEYARRTFSQDAYYCGSLEEQGFASEQFDLVTLWDVIEHVRDPHRLLHEVNRVLRPGGLLVLETQDVDSLPARLLGKRWHHFKHMEHLFHFSVPTLGKLLDRTGFSVEKFTRRHAGKHVTLGFIAERSGRLHPWLEKGLGFLKHNRASLYVNPLDEIIAIAWKQ